MKLSNGYAIQWGLNEGTGIWGLHTYSLPFDMIAHTFANAFAARNTSTTDWTSTQSMTGRGSTRGWYTETNPESNKIQGYESTQYIRIGKTDDTPKTIVCIKY